MTTVTYLQELRKKIIEIEGKGSLTVGDSNKICSHLASLYTGFHEILTRKDIRVDEMEEIISIMSFYKKKIKNYFHI